METTKTKLPKWLKQIIIYGHPLVWDICFTLFQKGDFKMLDVILKNIPALVIITILGYTITFYFNKISKVEALYKEMQKQDILTRLFQYTLFEIQFNFNEIGFTYEKNPAIEKTKELFLKKVNEEFKDKMLQSEIEKMVNDYFKYRIISGNIL